MEEKVYALYRHWLFADSVWPEWSIVPANPRRRHYLREMFEQKAARAIVESPEFPTPPGDAETVSAHLELQMFRTQIFFGLLYVVVEGYRHLGVGWDKVDSLLANEQLVEKLRLFRNGVFHYQKSALNKKISGLVKDPETVVWVKALHHEFERFFANRLPVPKVPPIER